MATSVAVPPQAASSGGLDPSETTVPEARPSALSQVFNPVAPARPTTHLGTTASLAQDTPAADASGSTSTGGRGKAGTEETRDGPFGALIRALAGRLGRGGTATTVKQSHDIKETRVSGNSTTGNHQTKADRTAKHDSGNHRRSNRDAKVADLNNKVDQRHGRNNSDTKKADTTDAKTSKADTRAAKNDNTAKKDDKNHRDGRTDATSTNASSTKNDTSATTDNTARSNRDNRTSGSTDSKSSQTNGRRGDVTTSTGRDAGPFEKPSRPDRPTKGQDGGDPAKGPTPLAGPQPPGGAKADLNKATDAPSGPAKPDPKGLNTKVDLGKKDRSPTSPGTSTREKQAQAPRPRTQSSREAGYRHGDQAAAAVGHVRAWRDGTRDGWEDRTAADLVDRKRMDTAKARNDDRRLLKPDKAPAGPAMAPAAGTTANLAKKTPTPPIPPKPTTPPTIPAKPTTAPTIPAPATEARKPTPAAKPATQKTAAAVPNSRPAPASAPITSTKTAAGNANAVPVDVTFVGSGEVAFRADGAKHTLGRGEVRNLRQFEQRLAERAQVLARIGDDNKTAQQHALAHAMRAQQLAEAAKEIKGGVALVGALHRLAEQAAALRYKTDEVAKRTTRGAEAVRVLAANARTRHGVIYKAVVDSPLTTPAERAFYQDKQGS